MSFVWYCGIITDLITQVKEKLGLSFNNIRGLHQVIDEEIPERAGQWKTDILEFSDLPDLSYVIRYRDPLEAIRSLWKDLGLSPHLVYRASKVWTDKNRKCRIYNELWTGQWWHAVQVRFIKNFTTPLFT